MNDPVIRIYESNAGSVYLAREDQIWAIGPVTPDLSGCATQDAAAWASGDWEPNEIDGQQPVESVEDLDLIASWSVAGGLTIEYDSNGNPVAQGGGRDYLGEAAH